MGARIQTEIIRLHGRLDGLRDEAVKVLGSLETLRRGKPGRNERERLHTLEMRALNLCDLLAANKAETDALIDGKQ